MSIRRSALGAMFALLFALVPMAAFAATLNTSTSITSDTPDPSTVGQAYTVNVTVGTNPASNSRPANATVTVSDGSGATCTDSSGTNSGFGNNLTLSFSCALTSTSAGAKSLTASYAGGTSGANTFNSSVSSAASHTVNKGTQTITFNTLANKTLGDADFTVSATASSNLAVAFSSQTTSVCTVTGSTVHLLTVGTCTVRASQAGDSNWNAATNVDRSFTVAAAALTPQTITVTTPAPASAQNGTTFNVAATANSGLPVAITTSGGCTGSGSGSATITAGATSCVVHFNQSGDSTHSAAAEVTETVATAAATPVGLITNPSFAAGSGNTATGWSFLVFHATANDNNAQGTIVTDAQDGDSRAAQTTITSYTSGAAKWVPTAVTVSQGQFYTLSFWYKSSTPTSVFLIPNGNDGNEVWQKDLPAAAAYTQVTLQILIPAGWTTMQPAVELASTGSVTVDNFDLELQPSAPTFTTGLVTISVDDGYQTFNDVIVPILNGHSFKATQYAITGPEGTNIETANGTPNPGYMSKATMLTLQSQGFEISPHTRDHLDLVKQTLPFTGPDGVTYNTLQDMWTGEINGSKTDLVNNGFTASTTFAYPYGSYNAQVEAAVQAAGITAARSVDQGENFSSTDHYALKIYPINDQTTVAQANAAIDQAMSNKTWLIFMFHNVRTSAAATGLASGICKDPDTNTVEDTDCTTSTVLQGIVDHLATLPTGTVVTMGQGVAAVLNGGVTSHHITVTAGANGSATPTSPISVANGASQTITFTPAANFKVDSITIDGIATTTTNSITLTNVIADHTVAVTFADAAVAPTVTLSPVTSPTNVSPIHVIATFSAPVTGFDATDVASTTNGTVVANSFAAASSTVYSWDVTPTADGTVLVQVPAGVAINAASSTLSNLVSNTLTVVSNRTIPTLTLVGDAVVETAVGQPYVDSGYTLTSPNNANVTVSTSTISTASVGEFTETYNAVDTAGNHAATVYRTVRVSELVPVSAQQIANTTSDSVTITWTTAASGTSRVVYDTVSHPTLTATSTNYGYANTTSEDMASTTSHSVTVSGLNAGTTYYFRTITRGSPEALGAEISATTANAPVTSGGGGGGGGGSGGSGGGPIGSYGGGAGFYYNGQGQNSGSVLGASTSTVTTGNGGSPAVCYKFSKSLRMGAGGAEVSALQNVLIAAGFLKVSAPTGHFGAMTKVALMAYQKTHGLEQVGSIGPKTRAMLNVCGGVMTDNTSLIEALKAQLKVLMDKLAALLAAGGSSNGSSTSTSTSTSMTGTTTPSMTGTSTPSMTGTSTPPMTSTSTPVSTSTSTSATTSTSTQQ